MEAEASDYVKSDTFEAVFMLPQSAGAVVYDFASYSRSLQEL